MYKLSVGLCLVGGLVVGLSQLSASSLPAAQASINNALSCEINGATLRPGESLKLTRGALSFTPQAQTLQRPDARWRSIRFELRASNGAPLADFSEMLRSGASVMLGGGDIGAEPLNVRCSF